MQAKEKLKDEGVLEQTRFLILDDGEKTWLEVEARSMEEAVQKCKRDGYDPHYAVEKHFAANVKRSGTHLET